MCLTVDTQKHTTSPPEHFIAEKDMEVYKVILGNNKSVVQEFQYSPNTLYTIEDGIDFDEVQDGGINYQITEGFHAYYDLYKSRMLWQSVLRNNPENKHYKFVKFVIPKGTEYYYGIYYDVVSAAIRSGDLNHINNENIVIKRD